MADIVSLNPKVRGYRDLMVWQQGRELVRQTYQLTQHLPKEELYGLTSQMRRCAVSVPSNIAEGHTRDSRKEYIYHLSIAAGSLAELQTQLLLCEDLEYLDNSHSATTQDLADKTLKMIRNLQTKLKNKN